MQALERLRPVAGQLPVGLHRSAFLGAMARHFGLPAVELESAFRGKGPSPVRPVPKTASPAPARPPDRWELFYAAALLQQPSLAQRDVLRAGDELSHLGLRMLIGRLGAGHPPDEVLAEADPSLQRLLESALAQLPSEPALLEQGFGRLCQKLKLHSVERQLRDLQQQAAAREGELDDDMRQALQRASELSALRQRLKAEAVRTSGAMGIKDHMQPV